MKLKLLYIPVHSTSVNDASNETESSIPYLPPSGIATLTSFMESNHFSVDQDDLMIKVHHHNYISDNPVKKINLEVFNDEKRINNFIKNKSDSLLEEEGEKILKMTKCNGYDIFGFSIYETTNPSTAGIASVLAKLLKEKYGSEIVIGGTIDERVEQRLVSTDFIDCRVIGHFTSLPELNLLSFCESFEKGIGKDKIPGIVYGKNGKVIVNYVNHKNEVVFVKPSFDGLPIDIYRRELSFEINGEVHKSKILILPYFIIKGCPFSCAFCARSTDPYWRPKSIDETIRELKELSREYKTKYFYFLNPEINPSYRWTEKLMEEIIKNDLNILWTDCANFRNIDYNLLKKLKAAGAVRLIFGFETASQRMLDYIGKGITIDLAERVLKLAYELGVWSQIEIICGFPYETENDINQTIDFIKRNSKYIQEFDIFKFWLDGLFKKHPERYKIKILEEGPRLAAGCNRQAFDEINGLTWEEKINQIDKRFDKLKSLKNKTFPKHTEDFPALDCEERTMLKFIRWWNIVNKTETFKSGYIS